MAENNNIQVIGNIINTTTVTRYSEEDINLMFSQKLQENFGGVDDYIEYYAYDAGNNLLNFSYNYFEYKLPSSIGLTPGTNTLPNTTGNIQTNNIGVTSTLSSTTSSLYPIIEIDPVIDLQNLGYSSGEFNVRYNFFQNKLSNYVDKALFVKEISPDRTEIRLASTSLTNIEIENVVNSMINEINSSPYYVDYLLNFGNNIQYVAINVALNKATTGYEVLFKLYEPLPLSVQEKQTLWVVKEKVNPYVFDINLDKIITPTPPPFLKGPNFDIKIHNQGTISTPYVNYYNLISGLQLLQQSSYHKILNLLSTQSIDINVDYKINEPEDFGNFVFFGSAYQRVTNFYTKVKEIEDYNTLINIRIPISSSTPSVITEINEYSSSISNIISNFDGYESYLYFESSSYTWPKSGSLKPFSLLSTGSATVISWYNNLTSSAEVYDSDNYNNLEYAVPIFLKDDDTNQPFLTFLNMVGHYFDNIWIYLKTITDLNVANNNLDYGISKDLVYFQLQSLGLKLYNSQAGKDVDKYLIGANTGSSIFNNDYSITGSYLNNIPRKDLVAELYKRIYHNLPLLLKQKGTVEGLENLITIFGIPSKPYNPNGQSCILYKVVCLDSQIDTEITYTPCGESNDRNYIFPCSPILPSTTLTAYVWVDPSQPFSVFPSSNATSSSIGYGDGTTLNVKEFGGSTKLNLIKGYNNDKVRVVSNTIVSGSVLSPFRSLQTFPSSSNEFRENDMHYVDISFSPQTQIDKYVSGAIASNNPTWSLDDYIGDPSQQYSSSYIDLDAQRKLYFQTGITGHAPFTASALDYNGFIRLIQYFDNSLFKMLADFVPERASLSTGVTFNSPVLERNKAVYANPTSTTTQSIYEADYNIATISSSYGYFYNALSSSNNTEAWYDGEISGSLIDIYQHFEEYNYNQYAIDRTKNQLLYQVHNFPYSRWNVLLNNVSKSVASNFRMHIENFEDNTSSIAYPAELQDSYLTLHSHNNSRYDGSKIISLLYNTYTSASYTGSDGLTIQQGDYSYGKTAAIDHYTRKIGLFTQIQSSSYLPRRNTVALKYLVDEFGNLTELNQVNKHWCDIQRTFMMSDTASVALFDNKKFGNQKSTDGQKIIFDSGYTYAPVLYASGSDTPLYFEGTGTPSAYLAISYNTNSSSYYLTGSSTLGYPLSGGIVTKLFNNVAQGNQYMSPGGAGGGVYNSWPSYSVQENGNYSISANLNLTLLMNSVGSASFSLQIYAGSTILNSQPQTFFFQPPVAVQVPQASSYYLYDSRNTPTILYNGIPVTLTTNITINGITYGPGSPHGSTIYSYPASTTLFAYPSPVYYSNRASLPAQQLSQYWTNYYTITDKQDLYTIDALNNSTPGTPQTKNFSVSIPNQLLNSGDIITARLIQVWNNNPNNFTASIDSTGAFTVSSLATIVGNYPYTSPPYFSPLMTSSNNTLVLSNGLSNYYSTNYAYLPYYGIGEGFVYSSSLYSQYGDIDYSFQLTPFSIFTAYDSQNSYFESRITNIYKGSDGLLRITLTDNIPSSLINELTGSFNRFLFLKRIEDETNTYLTFTKRSGKTSYGFLIPENLSPDILENIDTITKQVKQKLINDQGFIIGDLTSGNF